MTITLLIAHLSSGSVLIPLSIAIIQWKKLPVELKILRWVIICALLTDACSLIFFSFSLNTHVLGNSYLLVQFFLLVNVYGFHSRNQKQVILIYVLFTVFYIINISFFQGFFTFNTNAIVVSSLLLIFLSLRYFYKLLIELPSIHIQKLPMLWISFAVLTYYSGTLFIFLASNLLFQSTDEPAVMMWILHNLLNIAKNILFAIALWQSYRNVRSSTLSSSAP
jgi:hypothetical protein